MTGKKQDHKVNRREFIKTAAITGAGVQLAATAFPIAASAQSRKVRYAHVGMGSRSGMYQRSIFNTHKEHCEYVGFCDTNEGRLKLVQDRAKEATGKEIPIFAADAFDVMVEKTKPDAIIVTTVDGYHHEYIIRGMELGCDVITEKPMTIDEKKAQQIIDAQKKTGKKCTVT